MELPFRGANVREHCTKIATNGKLTSIQKFALVIITRFSTASQRRPLDAGARFGHGRVAAKELQPSWQIIYTNAFWESEIRRNLLFF